MPNPTQPPRGDTGPQHSYETDRKRLGAAIADHASAWMARQQPRQMKFDVSDLLDALGDAFAIRAGLPVRNPHPGSTWASELSMERLCAQLQCRSLTSSDFGNAMAVGFRQLVTSAYSAVDDCAACFLDSVVPNFQPVSFPVVDEIDLAALPPSNGQMASHIPLQLLSAGSGEPQGRVQSYRARVLCSRQLLLSDDFMLVANLIQHLSGHAARLPGVRLADILNVNPNLTDGDPLIGVTTTTHGASVAALGEATALLRTVLSPTGNLLNLAAAAWLVPPSLEMPARQTLKLLDTQIQLVVNPWLDGANSFVLCNPAVSPVFARLMLAQPLTPSVSSVPAPPNYDGQVLDVELAFGIAVVSRAGLVAIPV